MKKTISCAALAALLAPAHPLEAVEPIKSEMPWAQPGYDIGLISEDWLPRSVVDVPTRIDEITIGTDLADYFSSSGCKISRAIQLFGLPSQYLVSGQKDKSYLVYLLSGGGRAVFEINDKSSGRFSKMELLNEKGELLKILIQ